MAVRIGVIGCGYWGSKVARDVTEAPGAELTFICDADPTRLADVAWNHPRVRRAFDAAAVTASAEVDAVMIVTPLASHFALAKAALEAGKHVYVEKLLGESPEEAEELARLAAAAGRVLWVGHTVLHDPPVARLRRLVDAGAVGPLCRFRADRTSLGPRVRHRGVLWDLVPHDLSLLLRLTDRPPLSVRARGTGRPAGTVEVTVDFGAGLVADLRASWDDPVRAREIRVETEAAVLRYEPLRAPGLLRISGRPGGKVRAGGGAEEARGGAVGAARTAAEGAVHATDLASLIGVEGASPADREREGRTAGDDPAAGVPEGLLASEAPAADNAPPLLRLVGAFAACCAEGGCPETGADIGVRVLQILAACEASMAKDGAEQAVDVDVPRRAGARR